MKLTIKNNLLRIIITGLCLAICFLLWFTIMPYFTHRTTPKTNVATVITNAPILKPFSLIDTKGQDFTNSSLRGHWTLIFFGYAKCPDICPRTLNIIKESWQIFNTTQQRVPVKFVFADINTNQVDNKYLSTFLHNYNAEFLGVSGPTQNMRDFSDQLGIYATSNGEKIDHTATLLLLNPYGKLYAIFSPPFSAQDIVHDLEILTL